MLAKLKLVAYGILIPLVIWFAWGFRTNYVLVMEARESSGTLGKHSKLIDSDSQASSPTNSAETLPDATNSVETTSVTTNSVTDTNILDVTNSVAADSNTVAAVAAVKSKAKRSQKAVGKLIKVSAEDQEKQLAALQKSMAKCLVGLVLSAIGLGLLIAYDIPAYFAHRTVDLLFDDDSGGGGKDPEYERAEQVWADGRPMEAIEIMREYLKKHPREQYVALRIAEIYEKDFRNYLAAALEYEEILKKKLPAERWGWSAIHLCNLYTKLGRDADHNKLLERIVKEYPKCSAAKKARSRLGLSEDAEIVEEEAPQPEPKAKKAPPPEPEQPSNLPSGFRPKK